MKFASAAQIVVLTIVSCVGLFPLDYFKNPQLWRHPTSVAAAHTGGAYLVLWMNHLCCTDVLRRCALHQALAAVPGIQVSTTTTG